MSISQLLELRKHGSIPKSVVWVLVGDAPKWIDDGVNHILINKDAKPAHMDFRALVKLDVSVYEIGAHGGLFKAVLDAIEAIRPERLFFACRHCISAMDEKHESIMKNNLEKLQWLQ